MLFILDGVGVKADGHVEGKLSGTPDGVLRSQGYIAGKPFVATASGTSTDGYNSGFRYSKAGALRVYDASAGVPANSTFNAGIAVTPDGAACFIATASASSVGTAFLVGICLDSQGRFFMNMTA